MKKLSGKIIAIDLDGTLTFNEDKITPKQYKELTPGQLEKAYFFCTPNLEAIQKCSALWRDNLLYIFTTRSSIFHRVTESWLKRYGVLYDHIQYDKPYYDLLIDDKARRDFK